MENQLFVEILAEEIPARLQEPTAAHFRRLVLDGMREKGLMPGEAAAYSTPRRIVLLVDGVPARTPDSKAVRNGPRTDAPQKAIDGFLRSAGLDSIEQAEIVKDAKKGDHYRITTDQPGEPAAAALAAIIPAAIKAIPFPKTMAWDDSGLKWIRPIRLIVARLGDADVNFTVGNVKAGAMTLVDSRFKCKTPVLNFSDYLDMLNIDGHKTDDGYAQLVLDPADRRQAVAAAMADQAAALGLAPVDDPGLLAEVAGLVEYPDVLVGEFDAKYLELPDVVIRTVIRECQRCFVLAKPDGGLANRFVIVSNNPAGDRELIRRGNEKVVRARLEDAAYFWNLDCGSDFARMQDSLADMTYFADLGSMLDRVSRTQHLAVHLAEPLGADETAVSVAALYCKNDLCSRLVNEFPSLQGKVGRLLAERKDNPLPPAVAAAIEEHYWPLGQDRPAPANPVAAALAAADRIDRLACFHCIGRKPKGNADPFGLRRAAIDLLKILLAGGFRIDIYDLAERAAALFRRLQMRHDKEGAVLNTLLTQIKKTDESARVAGEIAELLFDKLRTMLREDGVRHDVIDAVLSGAVAERGADPVVLWQRAQSLGPLLDAAGGGSIPAGLRRIDNILGDEQPAGAVRQELLEEPAEQELHRLAEKAKPRLAAMLKADPGDFEAAAATLAGVWPALDRFFDDVLVNCDDEKARANRRQLLQDIRAMALAMADFSKIVIERN